MGTPVVRFRDGLSQRPVVQHNGGNVLWQEESTVIVHEYALTAAVDPQVVWDRWTRIDAWPVDSPNVVRAQLNGPVAVGAVGWVKPRRGPKVSFRIVDANRMAGHFELLTRLLLGTMDVEREMSVPGRPTLAFRNGR